MTGANELVDKGVAEYARGLHEQAERLWREALVVDPGCERARTYLGQLRAPRRGGLRSPGMAAEPAPVGEPADGAQPEEEPSGVPTPPPRGPARFSLSPEKLAAAHRPAPRVLARKTVLLVATAAAVIGAIAWGLMAYPTASPVSTVRRAAAAASRALADLHGGALRIARRLGEPVGPEPASPGSSRTAVAPGPPQQRGGGSDRRKATGPVRRSTGSAEPAAPALPADGTLRKAALGTRWGMTLGELLTVLPSASRISQGARSELWPLEVEARADRVDLGGQPYRADFLFDDLGRLGAIRLQSILETTGDAVYEGLRASLAAELGEPSADQDGLASLGRWAAHSSWDTGLARVELEVRRRGLNAAPVLLVDIRKGDLMPINDSTVVLTLVAPGGTGERGE